MTEKMQLSHDYLSRIQSLAYKIDAIDQALADLESRSPANLRAVQYDAIKVQTSGGDPMLNYIAAEGQYKSDLLAARTAYTESQNEAIKRINRLQNGLSINVLTRRYVLGQTWEAIAAGVHYQLRNMVNIKHKALKEFAEANKDLWPKTQ